MGCKKTPKMYGKVQKKYEICFRYGNYILSGISLLEIYTLANLPNLGD
jgi:hypothetical protein